MIFAQVEHQVLVVLAAAAMEEVAAQLVQLILAAGVVLVTEVSPLQTAQTVVQVLSSSATQEHNAARAARSLHLVATPFTRLRLLGHLQHESFC
jgi:hypothetical protein